MAVWAVARLRRINQRSRLYRCKSYTTDIHKGQSCMHCESKAELTRNQVNMPLPDSTGGGR